MRPGSIHELVSGRELLTLLYRLARNRATGVVEIARPQSTGHALVLCRGQVVVSARGDARDAAAVLRRFAAEPQLRVRFDAGVTAYPPSDRRSRRLALDAWILAFLESSVSGVMARELSAELAGARVCIRAELAPDPRHLDDTGRRLLAALGSWRRVEELTSRARAPRFRTLAFLFALRSLHAVELAGVVTRTAASTRDTDEPIGKHAARRLLGLGETADRAAVKRAYRRMARALHPDLRAGDPASAALETKLVAVNRAYRVLLRSPYNP